MLETNSILRNVTSFLRLCLHNCKEKLDKRSLSILCEVTLWESKEHCARTVPQICLLPRVICLGHTLVLPFRLSLAFTTQGILCDFAWSFLPVFHSFLKGTHFHFNCVVDF